MQVEKGSGPPSPAPKEDLRNAGSWAPLWSQEIILLRSQPQYGYSLAGSPSDDCAQQAGEVPAEGTGGLWRGDHD